MSAQLHVKRLLERRRQKQLKRKPKRRKKRARQNSAKAETERQRIKRAYAKKLNSQSAKIGEERAVEDSEVEGPWKHACNIRSHIRKSRTAPNSIYHADSTAISHSNDTNIAPITVPEIFLSRGEKRWSNSILLRSGRNTRLPARFL